MVANCGFISERRSSMLTSCTGRQASSRLERMILTTLVMMDCSMGVKSRPSILGWVPAPPKKFSTRENTRRVSTTRRALPRNGSILNMFMLVGTGRERMNSPNLDMSMEIGFTSTRLRMVLANALVINLEKRSLMISKTGMRPRMIRSWLARSKETMPPGVSTTSSSVSISPPKCHAAGHRPLPD